MLSTIKTEQLMGIFTYTSRQKFFFSTMVFLSGFLSVWAQCPTVNDATPSFCDTDSPRISMLNSSVTDGGSGIAWYANETGGSPLAGTTQLINGTTYYVDQAAGSCGARQSVQVTIYATPLTKDNKAGVVICITDPNNLPTLQGSIITSNEFIGVGLKYYGSEFGLEQLLGTHVLSDGELIYASQTNPETGCETTRGVLEIIFRNATTPTGESPQNFCNDPDAPAPLLSNIVTVGGNTYYDSPTATLRLNPNTPLQSGVTYYISRVSGSCESDRLPVEVTLDEILQPEASTPLEYCINNIAQNNVNLFDQFTIKPAQTGTWSTTAPVVFTNPADFNGSINLSTLLEGSYTFTYTVPSTTTCPDQVNTVTVNIVPLPNAGEDGTANFCTAGAAEDLFTYLLPKNTVAPEAGGTWTFNGNPHSGTFDPLNDIAGVYTYTVEKTPCDPDTATVTVTTDSQVKIGSGNTVTYCETKLGSIPVVNLFSEIVGETDTNGVWTNTQGIAMGGLDHLRTVDPNTFTVEGSPYTFTYTLPQVGICPPLSTTVTVVIEPLLIAGEDGTAKLCSNQSAVDLFTYLGGTPSVGGTWTGPSALVNGMFDPAVHLAGTYKYTVNNVDCVDSDADVVVTIDPFVDPGVSGSLSPICVTNVATTAPINLFDNLSGTPAITGVWTGPVGFVISNDNIGTVDISGMDTSGITEPTSLVFTYTVPSADGCDNFSTATVTIPIEPLPNAGLSNPTPEPVCSVGAFDLMTLLGGTPQQSGSWSFNGASVNNPLDLSTAQSGTYTYTVISIGCNDTKIATVELNVQSAQNPGESIAMPAYCISVLPTVAPFNLFDELGGAPSVGGTWSGPIATAGAHLGTVNIQTLAAGTHVFTYTIAAVGECPLQSATVTIVINEQLSAGENNSITVCSTGGNVDLFSRLNGNPSAGGIWTFNGNPHSGIFNPLADAIGQYRYRVVSEGCFTQIATVTVAVDVASNPGVGASRNFCETQLGTLGNLNLFSILTNSPQTTGTWTSSIATQGGHLGTVNLDALTVGSYTFTYTTPANGVCTAPFATVVINIDPIPNAGTAVNGGILTVCASDPSFNLMTLLTGAQSGGAWTVDGNPVASTTFNPASSPAGVYTYTVTSLGCVANQTDTESITISKTPAPNAGENAVRNVCIDDVASLTAINLHGLLTGNPSNTGTWTGPTPTSGGHLGTVDLSGLTVGSYVYTYTVAGSGACTEASRTVTIVIDDLPNAGTATESSVSLCSTDANIVLTDLLTDAQSGGVWTVNGNVVPNTLDLATAVSGTYRYTVTSLGCGGQQDTEDVVINIQRGPDSGTSGAARRVCISNVNSTSVRLFDLLAGTPEADGSWSASPAITGTGSDAVLNLSGFVAGSYDFTYTVNGFGACSSPSETTVSVIVEPLNPSEGTVISTTNIVCASQAPFDLHDLLQGEDLGGTWMFNSAPLSSTIFNPASSLAGTYSYTISSSSCGGGQSRTSNINIQIRNVLPELTSLSLASQRVCSGTSAAINFEGVADAVVTYQINGGANQTVQLNGSGIASVQTGALSSNITVRATSVAYPGPLSCSQPVAGVADVTVTVESNDPKQGSAISPLNVVCSSQAAFDLNTLLQGEDLGGVWLFNNAPLASSTFDPAVNLSGTYTYRVESTSCNIRRESTVVIDIRNTLPIVNTLVATSTSVCSGNSTSVTFNGSPDAVVTYQINGGTNQTVVLNDSGVGVVPTANLSAVTTYKAISVAYPGPLACSQPASATAETTISIDALPIATISGTQSVCEGSNPTITITGTPNAVVAYRIGSGSEIDLNLGATGTQTITINNIQDTATYTLVRATSDKNCPQVISNQSATITVNKFVNPVINASSLTVCNGSAGNLVVTPNVANALATLTYNIDGGANQTAVLDASGTATIVTGSLTQNAIINLLRLQTAIDCARDLVNVSFPITVTPLPQVTSFTVSNDKVCSGGSSIATIQGTPNAAVTYNNGIVSNTVVLDGSGVGTITLNNITTNTSLTLISIANTCNNSATGSISVEVIPLPNVAAANVSINSSTVCYETSNTVSISNATDLDGDYVINYTLTGPLNLSRSTTVNFAGGAGSFVINSSDINASGTITVTIQDIESVSTGCSVSGATFNNTVNFTVYPQVPAATLKPKGEAFCSKESPVVGALTARLNLAQGTIVRWYEENTGGNPLADNVSLINGETYYAEIESISNGCTTSSRLEVIVDTNKCLFIPEGFSPNDDGINDLLVFENLEYYYPDYSVEIYNRYGNKLYTGNAQTKPWDGRAGHGRIGSDDILPTGVYFYILNYNVAGKEAKQGVIYLSR